MQADQGEGKRAAPRQRHAATAAPPGAAGLQALQGLPDEALGRLADAMVVSLLGAPLPAVDPLLHRLADLVADRLHRSLAASPAPAAPVAVATLLRDTHAAIKGDIWAVRDLRALALLDWPMRNSQVGQILSAHADQVIDGFRLRRMTKRSTNEGQLYKIEAVDGDDLGSSSPGAVDTMQALQLAWRTPR